MAERAGDTTRGGWLVFLVWALGLLALWPVLNVPFVDDWVYAWTVDNLLHTGRLETLDFSSNMTYVQAGWGALFCLPAGFSFTALRLSTLVLGGVTILGIHRLSREAGASADTATLAAAVVAVYPPFVVLANSFMTDVPLLAVETWTLVYFVRAVRRQSTRDLWVGALLATMAGATRYVGLVPALAASAALLLGSPWGRRRGRWLVPLASVVAVALVARHSQQHIRHVADVSDLPLLPAGRLLALETSALALLPSWLPLSVEFALVQLGLVLMPLALGVRPLVVEARRRRLLVLVLAAVVVAAIGSVTGLRNLVFTSEGPWYSEQLDSVLTLLPAWTSTPPPFSAISGATILCWAVCLIAGVRAWPEERESPNDVLWWTLAGLVAMTALLWLTTDRYILPFVPPALALAARGVGQVSWRRAALPLALYAAIAAIGVRDRTAAERAVWTAVDDLRARGIAAADIDAGYTVNGWLQYAHPDDARRDAAGEVDVPFVNGSGQAPWVVANFPQPGATVVRAYAVSRVLRPPRAIYVLRR